MKTRRKNAPGMDERAEKTEKAAAPAVQPFEDALEYLEAWFGLLGPSREEDESPAALRKIPSFDERKGYFGYLSACTTATLEAGVRLPFEAFASKHDLDVIDRLILLTLLRNAVDPVTENGIRPVYLFRALGADSVTRQSMIIGRLDEEGALRNLGAVHCCPGNDPNSRVYRLAPWLVKPLTTGEGDVEGIPAPCLDPLETIDRLVSEVASVWEAVGFDTTQSVKIWSGPASTCGWDHTVLRRRRLAVRLEACARAEGSTLGAELWRLGLDWEERLCWAMLLVDALKSPVGIPVARLIRCCGPVIDAAAAAEKLLGPGSKLGRENCVRFNRADVPLLRRIVWMPRAAYTRVVPWERGDMESGAGRTGDTTLPRMGFDAQGTAAEGSAQPERGAA